MNEVNNMSLYNKSVEYAITPASPQGSILFTHKQEAFKAGAQWQKEQDKEDFKKALEQIKEMGAIIRKLDDDNVHSEYWLNDENYIPFTEYLENK